MNHVILTFWLMTTLWLFPKLAVGDEQETALLRAVAAKELAFDHPEPAEWQEAFDRFLEADAQDPSADTKYELAFIAAQLKQNDVAYSFYEDAIAFGLNGPARDKASSFLNQKSTSIARLNLHGKKGFHVRVRGIFRGVLPLTKPLVVYPGVTRLEVVDSSGRRIDARAVYVPAGQTEWVDLDTIPQVIPKTVTIDTSGPSRLTPTASVSSPSVGTWFLGMGSGILLTSALTLPIAVIKLDSKRDQLADTCDVPSRNPDGCPVTKRGRYTEGLSLANDIARWKTVRNVAYTGLGVGLASAALGLLLVTKTSKASRPISEISIWPTAEPNLAVLNCRIAF